MRSAKVIDLSVDFAGAYCSRMLASCGADVVQVEPPAGHPLRRAAPLVEWADAGGEPVSAAYEYLAAYKRSLVLDLDQPAGGATLHALLQGADLVITSRDSSAAAAESAERYRAQFPRGVHVITSPFGMTGPYADLPSSDLVDWAVSGYLYVTGDPGRPPVQGAGPWCSYAAGLTAAIGAIAASFHARRTGQGQVVDVGTMEAMAALHQWSFVLYTHQGVVKRRAGNRHAESHHPVGFLRCKDGWVCIGALGPAVWEAFCIAIDMPELLLDPRFATAADRFDHGMELDALLARWLDQRPRQEIVEHLQRHRVLAGRVLTPLEVLDDPQLAARDFWVAPEHLGAAVRMPGLPFRLGSAPPAFRPAPQLGEHTAAILSEAGLDGATIAGARTTGIARTGESA